MLVADFVMIATDISLGVSDWSTISVGGRSPASRMNAKVIGFSPDPER